MPHRILILAPQSIVRSVADFLRRKLDYAVDGVTHRRAALAALRRTEYALLIVAECFSEDPELEALYRNANGAAILELPLGALPAERLLRQVNAALQRRAADRARAYQIAAGLLQGDLKASLSGLLLESQLALRDATPALRPKLEHVVELAGTLRRKLAEPLPRQLF